MLGSIVSPSGCRLRGFPAPMPNTIPPSVLEVVEHTKDPEAFLRQAEIFPYAEHPQRGRNGIPLLRPLFAVAVE